jgi:hypothetical protein
MSSNITSNSYICVGLRGRGRPANDESKLLRGLDKSVLDCVIPVFERQKYVGSGISLTEKHVLFLANQKFHAKSKAEVLGKLHSISVVVNTKLKLEGLKNLNCVVFEVDKATPLPRFQIIQNGKIKKPFVGIIRECSDCFKSSDSEDIHEKIESYYLKSAFPLFNLEKRAVAGFYCQKKFISLQEIICDAHFLEECRLQRIDLNGPIHSDVEDERKQSSSTFNKQGKTIDCHLNFLGYLSKDVDKTYFYEDLLVKIDEIVDTGLKIFEPYEMRERRNEVLKQTQTTDSDSSFTHTISLSRSFSNSSASFSPHQEVSSSEEIDRNEVLKCEEISTAAISPQNEEQVSKATIRELCEFIQEHAKDKASKLVAKKYLEEEKGNPLEDIKWLDFSGSSLQFPKSFGLLKELIRLDLTGCELSSLSDYDFPKLQTLNLCGNQFQEVPEMVLKNKSLTWIDLSENPIKKIPLCLKGKVARFPNWASWEEE